MDLKYVQVLRNLILDLLIITEIFIRLTKFLRDRLPGAYGIFLDIFRSKMSNLSCRKWRWMFLHFTKYSSLAVKIDIFGILSLSWVQICRWHPVFSIRFPIVMRFMQHSRQFHPKARMLKTGGSDETLLISRHKTTRPHLLLVAWIHTDYFH